VTYGEEKDKRRVSDIRVKKKKRKILDQPVQNDWPTIWETQTLWGGKKKKELWGLDLHASAFTITGIFVAGEIRGWLLRFE